MAEANQGEFVEQCSKRFHSEGQPTREDLVRIDEKRQREGSNAAAYAVDMDSGVSLAVTVQDGTIGDPTTRKVTIESAVKNVRGINRDARCAEELSGAAR